MRIFKGLENIHAVIDQHVAEWRKEQGEPPEPPEGNMSLEEKIRRHWIEPVPIKPNSKPRDIHRFFPDEPYEAREENNEPEIISVIKHEEEGHHSWLYKEVLKAIKDAAGDGRNTKIIAVFVPVVQNSKEFEGLPVNKTVTLSSPVQEEGVNIDIPDLEAEAVSKIESTEPKTVNEIVESIEPEAVDEAESAELEIINEAENAKPEAVNETGSAELEAVSEVENTEPEIVNEVESIEPETVNEIVESIEPEAVDEAESAEPEIINETENVKPEAISEVEITEPEIINELESIEPEAANEAESLEPDDIVPKEAEGFDDILPEGQDEPDAEEAEAFNKMQASLDESLREKAEELAQEAIDSETEAVIMPDFLEIDEVDDLLPAEDEDEEISVGEPMEFTEIPLDDEDAEIELQPDIEEKK